MPPTNRSRLVSFSSVAIIGFLLPFLTGFLGIMPLDQSIIFEAAARITQGEKLFTDFYLPYGIVPALIQSILFLFAGLSWFSYVLHAAIFNAIFAIIVLDILQLSLPHAKRSYLTGAAILIAWAFYPMTGTPFMDNHSFFFGLTAYWLAFRAFKKRHYTLLIWCFPCLIIGFYSKPLPVIFWIFPLFLEFYFNRRELFIKAKWLIYGIIIAAFFLLFPFLFFSSADLWYYSFVLPLHVGKGRAGMWGASNLFYSVIDSYLIWLPALIPLVIFLFNLRQNAQRTLTKESVSSGNPSVSFVVNDPEREHIFLRILLIAAITVVSAALTLNSFYNITTPVFLLLFFVFHEFNMRVGVQKRFKRLYRVLYFILLIFLILVVSSLNIRRTVQDMEFTTSDLKNFSDDIGIFIETPGSVYTPADIDSLFSIIKRNESLYIGDMQLVYSLSKRKNPWPFVHIHDGTSYNSRDVTTYSKVKAKLLNNLNDLKTTIIIQDTMWYKDEPIVSWLQPLKGELKDTFGNIRVYQLNSYALAGMLNNLNKNFEK